MNLSTIQTPGVYIQETDAFPNSVVGIPTAIPAFIGYTPKASYEGKSYINVPVKIRSLADFIVYFCLPAPSSSLNPVKQYSPQYYILPQKNKPVNGKYILNGDLYYSIVPDPSTIYYLYNSIRLFYENGGGDAYIVSVGPYGTASQKTLIPGSSLINPNVQLKDLQNGFETLLTSPEPTMYICPDATLLNPDDNGTLMHNMLTQADRMQTAVCLFDIIGGSTPDPLLYTKDIENFRMHTGSVGLSYGIAYYPFIGTSIMQQSEINYLNLFGGDISQLEKILVPADISDPIITDIIAGIKNPESNSDSTQNNNALINASSTYSLIINYIISDVNILPPSGAMAGIITTTDNNTGPWQAPANISINGVNSLTISLSDSQQEPLNVDPVSGKSINVIRNFNGLGILVWGARTLDGNSQDFRYISIRRTLIFIEQSCKLAAQAFIFEPNTKNTWEAVKSMIGSFLTNIWKEGGLQGSAPTDAFSVECGIGSTMTSEDLLNGYMRITVKVAVTRPAEFIVLTFQQQMAASV